MACIRCLLDVSPKNCDVIQAAQFQPLMCKNVYNNTYKARIKQEIAALNVSEYAEM